MTDPDITKLSGAKKEKLFTIKRPLILMFLSFSKSYLAHLMRGSFFHLEANDKHALFLIQ